MLFSSWLRKRTPTRNLARRTTATCRPRLEALDARDLPSTLTVTTTADSGPGSLRADVAAAQAG
jgi:hypothetical protein